MFGRGSRAERRRVPDLAVLANGLLKPYDPEAVAGAAAIGLGIAGGLGAGRSTTGRVLDAIGRWGVHEKLQFVPLPPTVLTMVTDRDVR